jgi:cobalt/nickel transport system ATP-binding protein
MISRKKNTLNEIRDCNKNNIENTGIVECNNLSFSYENGVDILKEISFKTEKEEAIGIVGANGAGKSTLLRILVGLESSYTGEVLMEQMSVKKENLALIRANVGYLFQDSDNQLFTQSVYQDIAFAPRNYKMSEAEVDKRVMEALDMLNITHLRDKQIYKMSGGEKKMASLATLMSMTPNIILFDEPSIALDPKNRRTLIYVLNKLNLTKLIASHDLDLILETCTRVILLSEGRIIKDGPTDLILKDKELLEANHLELPLCLQGYPLTN